MMNKVKQYLFIASISLICIQALWATEPYKKNERIHNHFPDGLYIIESGKTNFYSMTLINQMSISEKNTLITAILMAEEDTCWFVIANYHGYFHEFSGGIENWPENTQAMTTTPVYFYDIEKGYTLNVNTGEIIQAIQLRNLGTEGPFGENEAVYNIVDESSLLGTWSVSIFISRLPESYQRGPDWKIEINHQPYFFTVNPFDERIRETNIPDMLITDIDAIRNAFFSTYES